MTLQTWLQKTAPRMISAAGGRDQAWMEAEMLLAHVLKKDRAWIVAHAERALTALQEKKLNSLVTRRRNHEPMAYLLGEVTFFGRSFHVRRGVLIPRPETEELVARGLQKIASTKPSTLVWDVGVGSGAIAVTISLEAPTTRVIASDTNRAALVLARQNASPAKSISFTRANLLSPRLAAFLRKRREPHLLVLANLPYLPTRERRTMQPDVVRYEPSSALFAKEEGMFLIKKLLHQLAIFQKKDPRTLTILAEFHPPQASHLLREAKRLFPQATVRVHEDLCGRKRILEIQCSNPANV